MKLIFLFGFFLLLVNSFHSFRPSVYLRSQKLSHIVKTISISEKDSFQINYNQFVHYSLHSLHSNYDMNEEGEEDEEDNDEKEETAANVEIPIESTTSVPVDQISLIKQGLNISSYLNGSDVRVGIIMARWNSDIIQGLYKVNKKK
jgi:ubiquitin C-terminal hydrolase